MNEEGLQQLDLIGVPMDLGGSRRGTDMGPSALRIAGLQPQLVRLGHQVRDRGDLRVPARETTDPGDSHARFEEHIVAACDELRGWVREILAAGRFPLVFGGDHSIAIGTMAGLAGWHRERGEELGLLWIDAHADMNTAATSPSGNVHGMPLAAILGKGSTALVELGGFAPKVRSEHVVLVGVRDLDRRERAIVGASGIEVFTMKEVDRYGMDEVAHRALERISEGTAGFHVSLDLDGVDPTIAPGVGTPVRGGLSFRETHLLLELCADSGRLRGLEVVELNPILDDRNATAQLAVGFVESALGRQIL